MSTKQFQKDISSFVTFALKVKPEITFSGQYNDNGSFVKKSITENLQNSDNLSTRELATLEELLARYQKLKKYLPPKSTLSKLKIIPTQYIEPREKPEPGVKYKKVSVNASQFEIAKSVASRVDEIHKAYLKGDNRKAKTGYLELQNFMSLKRNELVGEFRTVRELEDTMGMYGIGLNGGVDPRDKMYWLPVFIVIEVWIG